MYKNKKKIKWIHQFLGTPNYQVFKQGPGFAVYTCKIKGNRNPLYKWTIGKGCLNEFAFSPCGTYIATVSQDGYLRIFIYETFELIGAARQVHNTINRVQLLIV